MRGNFEWQVITGRLENSGFTPPNTDYTYAGTKLYIPKINQSDQQLIGDFYKDSSFYTPQMD